MMKQRMPVYTDGEEPLTKEQVDAKLRHAGYDPDAVGERMDTVARQALKIAQLEAENERLRGGIERASTVIRARGNFHIANDEPNQGRLLIAYANKFDALKEGEKEIT